MKHDLVLAAIALSLASEEGVERPGPGLAPTAFRIWHAGANNTDMGPHVFSPESAQKLMAAQAQRGNRISIDVDHLSLSEGTRAAPPQSRVAVGWHELEVRQSGRGPELWAVNVQWADWVRAGLEKQPPEWKYFSPAYGVDKKTGEIDAYLNTALTNNPATWHVTALAAANRIFATGVRMNYQDIAAALFGDDEEKKKDARKCIAEMSEADRKAFEAVKKAAFASEEPKGGEPEKVGEEANKATETPEEKERKEAAARAALNREVQLATRVDALEKEIRERNSRDQADTDRREREAIFAKRPDIGEAVRASLSKLPLDDLKKFVETMPRVVATAMASANSLRAGGNVSGGEKQPTANPTLGRLTADDRRVLATRLLVARPSRDPVVRATRQGTVLEMPMFPPTPEQARARIKELEEALEAHHAEMAQ